MDRIDKIFRVINLSPYWILELRELVEFLRFFLLNDRFCFFRAYRAKLRVWVYLSRSSLAEVRSHAKNPEAKRSPRSFCWQKMTLFSTVKETTLKRNQHGQLNAPCCTPTNGFKGKVAINNSDSLGSTYKPFQNEVGTKYLLKFTLDVISEYS